MCAAVTLFLATGFTPAAHAQNSSVNGAQNSSAGSAPAPGANTNATPNRDNQMYRESSADREARLTREANQQALNAEAQANYAPEPPSPFQQTVEATTGQHLEVYGGSLFRRVPSTFAPVESIPVGPGYILGPDDELEIQLSGQVNRQLSLKVDRNGSISIPEFGTVHVAGLPYGQLNTYLSAQLGRIYRNFTVNATLGTLRTIQVFVVGQARRPGSFSVSSLSTLLNALFASGGPLATGSMRDIQLKRGGQTIEHFDLYDLLLRGDKSHDVALATGDVIFIPFAGPQVAVTGSVNHPGIYELKNDTTVSQALEFAGGENSIASDADVLLERVYEHQARSVDTVSLEQTRTTMLRGGDIVSVRSIINRFRNAVTLRGNVANPGRYAWHAGMRVSDLIPNKEALVTRDYWRKRNQLGQFLLQQQEVPILPQRAQPLYPQNSVQNGMQGSQSGQPMQNGTTQNPQMQGMQGGTNAPQLQSEPSEGSLQLNGNGQVNANEGATLAGNASSQAGGNSVGAALTGSSNLFQSKNDVVLSAPDIDWSYAVVERQDAKTLTTSLLPFNLGKIVLDSDASQNMELLPGDVVTIFSKADIRVPSVQQTRYVRLEGEFVGSGVYSVLPGETLRGLLRRAGGFTSDAYLYASEFTRESTRRVEQQRLSEYADELDAQISSVTASNQARAISGSDQAAAAASESAARAAVTRLRHVQPIGRIVLELSPDSTGIDTVPDIALEDGDRFVVPRVPSNVNVEGQVYSANAFVYRPGQRVKEFLHRAGGPDRQADRKRLFLLRADGSVVSRQYANVMKATVYPGDTIVVPPILDRRSILQRVIDMAQIVGSVGLNAATLVVLTRQ
jgi:protein involved in polysaccharide export with SLBB domain